MKNGHRLAAVLGMSLPLNPRCYNALGLDITPNNYFRTSKLEQSRTELYKVKEVQKKFK